MRRDDIPTAADEFEESHGLLEWMEPQQVGFSWAIGTQGENVVLAREYAWGFEFSLMTKLNYEDLTKKLSK